jgi:hypothetical protein
MEDEQSTALRRGGKEAGAEQGVTAREEQRLDTMGRPALRDAPELKQGRDCVQVNRGRGKQGGRRAGSEPGRGTHREKGARLGAASMGDGGHGMELGGAAAQKKLGSCRAGKKCGGCCCSWRRSTEAERQPNRGCADRRLSSLHDDAGTAAQIDGRAHSRGRRS